jgi:hypothetical protein
VQEARSSPAKRLSFDHRPSSGCFADPLRTGFPCSSSSSEEKPTVTRAVTVATRSCGSAAPGYPLVAHAGGKCRIKQDVGLRNWFLADHNMYCVGLHTRLGGATMGVELSCF